MTRSVAILVGACAVGAGAWLLAGCGSGGGCQSGAESNVAAVQELLAAAVESDAERACVVTSAMTDDELDANLREVAAFVEGAGGIEVLRVSEDTSRAMGSESLVEVAVRDSTARVEFTVIQSAGRYVVGLSDVGSNHGPTTDPDGPAEQASPTGPSEA